VCSDGVKAAVNFCKDKTKGWFEMPACQNCGKKWMWKQTLKTLFRFRTACPYCGKRQYLTAMSKMKSSMLGIIPIIVLPVINGLFHFSWWMVGVIMTPVLIVICIVYPYMIEVSNEDEPLW
jgi:CXXC-20-CXXC protein